MVRHKWTLILLLLAGGTCFGQQFHPVPKPYYDTFNDKWINPNKWQATIPQAWGNPLEIVREVRNGQLRLAIRNTGRTDSNSGSEGAENELYFVKPDHITSITADLTVLSAKGITCPASSDFPSGVQLTIGGSFFNTGTGDPAQDVAGLLVANSEYWDPKALDVGLWWGNGEENHWTHMLDVPIGQWFTWYIKWDQANHRFIGRVWANGVETEVLVPYSVPDSTPVAAPSKSVAESVTSQNCTAPRTFSHAEALFDNVMINQ